MYNRYIPQPDGSFRRNRVPDQSRPSQRPVPPKPSCPPPQEEVCPPSAKPIPPRQETRKHEPRKQPPGTSPTNPIGGFLRQLLPKDFDTSDLIVVLLLLLIAGDCQEDQNTALLTLAIYLFL